MAAWQRRGKESGDRRLDAVVEGCRLHATQAGIEKYNKFYDNYTGLIDNLNGIGGGAAVAGGAAPTPALGF